MTAAIFKTWETNRKLYAAFFDQYSVEQFNTIPAGFSNNLAWNTGHIIVAQQSLVYRLSGLDMYVSEEMFNQYKPGSKPTGNTSKQELDELQSLLFSLVDKTKEDYYNNRFTAFTERTTITGFHLANLNDALAFNNYHEGLHLGMMMSIRKFI